MSNEALSGIKICQKKYLKCIAENFSINKRIVNFMGVQRKNHFEFMFHKSKLFKCCHLWKLTINQQELKLAKCRLFLWLLFSLSLSLFVALICEQ